MIGRCTTKGTCAYAAKADASPCDDGNACTTADACTQGDSCQQGQCESCQAGQCEPGVNTCQCKTTSDCNKFEDGDQCNGTLYCDKTAGAPYTCKVNPASVVSCPSVNNSACQKNTCVPATGQCKLILSPENTPCDDGDSCTTGDFCDTGLCQGGANTCYCKKDSDCKSFEDGNLCNGSLFCNKATAQCQVNPITVVTCQTVDDTQCLRNTCNPKEGKCYLLPLKDGKVCEDGNPCTPNEACDQGQCQSAVNTCECQKDADCQAKDDGNLCNGTLYCDVQAKKCRTNPATVVSCNTDDDLACLADVCDPKTGKCKEIGLPKDGTACDDGNACTALSLCSAGSCVGQANVCECQKDGDCAAKEDGNLCNGKLFCNPNSSKCEVNPATVVACANGFDENCLTNQCDPKTGGCGMQPAHQGNQCDDGSVCSAGGWCALGTCEVTLKQACECVQDSDCAKLEDGDLCNGTLYCDKTGGGNAGGKPSCKLNPSTLITCPTVDNTSCSKAMCQAKSGKCAQAPVSGLCEDGKVCTEKDGCLGGQCVGLLKLCSDGIACTTDSCQEPFGCVYLPGSASACEDGNVCTVHSCDLKQGCLNTPAGDACDDGNPCTIKDACGNGQCQGGSGGCGCDDGNPCTLGELCTGGVCGFATLKSCDDGNACTDDACDKATGCYHYANQASCSTKGCTLDDVCTAGTCKAGATTALGVLITGPGPTATPKVHVRGVHVASDHMLVYGGLNTNLGNSPTTAGVARGTMAGQWLWQQSSIAVGNDNAKVAIQGFPNSLGGLDVVLQTNASRPTMARVDAKGAIVTVTSQEIKGFTAYTHAAVYRPASNDYLTVGSRTQPGKAVDWGWLAVFSAVDLAFGQTAAVDEFQGGAWLYAVTLAHDGKSVVAVGKTPKPGAAYYYEPLFLLQGADLLPTSRTATVLPQGPNGDHAFRAVTQVLGGYLAAGVVYSSLSSYQYEDILLARFDLKGNLQWSKNLQMASGSHEIGTAILGLADGTALLGGQYNPLAAGNAPDDLFLLRLDALGQPLTTRTYASAGSDNFYSLAQTGPGKVTATGTWHDGTAQRGWLLRTTPFLHEDCAAAGLCQEVGFGNCGSALGSGCHIFSCTANTGACSLAFSAGALCTDGDACTHSDTCASASNSCLAKPVLCDDKNPCTAETCSKTVGCIYANLPDGTQCGGGKLCTAGACQ